MLKAIFYGRQLYRINIFCSSRCKVICLEPNRNFAISSNKVDLVLKHSSCYLKKMLECHITRHNFTRFPFSTGDVQLESLSKNQYESICNETLESLSEYFEEIIECCGNLKGCDVTYSDGVLTVHFGEEFGTYVINRQSPNRQIWLSSPTSGPKRYDFIPERKQWVYRHDNKSLHELLQEEIPKIVKSDINFFNCAYGGE